MTALWKPDENQLRQIADNVLKSLAYVNLFHANLKGAILEGAILKGAIMAGGICTGKTSMNTDLEHYIFGYETIQGEVHFIVGPFQGTFDKLKQRFEQGDFSGYEEFFKTAFPVMEAMNLELKGQND